MPGWNDILAEMFTAGPNNVDLVRHKYIENFAKYRGRNVIAYYSGWLQKPGAANVDINDVDKNGFMATIHKMDRSKGLDLILHTPGGVIAATDSIVDYLHQMFGNDIEVFIPQLAMSAGTMIACSSRKIHMGKQSSIGPFDPQYMGISCHGVLEEFETAIAESQRKPGSLPFWRAIVEKYNPTFIGDCKKMIKMSSEFVKTQLQNCMFAGKHNAKALAGNVVNILADHKATKMHDRHYNADFARACGLVVDNLEDDQRLQDAVLSVHHCFMYSFTMGNACKIIENDLGVAVMTF